MRQHLWDTGTLGPVVPLLGGLVLGGLEVSLSRPPVAPTVPWSLFGVGAALFPRPILAVGWLVGRPLPPWTARPYGVGNRVRGPVPPRDRGAEEVQEQCPRLRLRTTEEISRLPVGHTSPSACAKGPLPGVDREYREKTVDDERHRVAPCRLNPEGEAYLPILCLDRNDRSQWAVVTEASGPMESERVVRGREATCQNCCAVQASPD